MSYQTIIPQDQVAEADLIALVEKINALTKSGLVVERWFVIETDDANLSSMLDSLMEAIPSGKPTAPRTTGKAKKTTQSSAMTSHQVRLETTGEIMSRQAFNKLLAAGTVEELTNVTNAKGEQFVVMDGKLVKGPQA
jgi:hypothetical protein